MNQPFFIQFIRDPELVSDRGRIYAYAILLSMESQSEPVLISGEPSAYKGHGAPTPDRVITNPAQFLQLRNYLRSALDIIKVE